MTTYEMKHVKIFRVNGVHLIAQSVDEAIALWRDHREQIELKTLQCYRQAYDPEMEIDVVEVKYMQSVWME